MTTSIPAMPKRVRQILNEVALAHGIGALDIVSPSSRRKEAYARWEWYSRIISEVRINGAPPSLPQIGRWVGRDHTSVLYGLRRHVSGLTWSKGADPSAYKFGRRRGAPFIRLQLAQDIAMADGFD